jgi:hypothetical protein
MPNGKTAVLVPPNISPFESAFAREYVNNGFKGNKAYQHLKPHVQANTAIVNASQMLARANVKEEVQRLIEERDVQSVANKDKLLQEMHQVRQKAYKNNKLQTSLNASVEKAKLAGHYREQEGDLTQYQTLINNLVVNIGANRDSQEPEPVDGQVIEGEKSE